MLDQVQPRHGIGVEDGQSFQWLEKGVCGMQAGVFAGPVGPHNKLGAGTAGKVCLKDLVRIVEIREHDVEGAEVTRQCLIQRDGATGEEAGQSPRLNRVQFVDESPGERKLRNMGITEQFDMGVRELLPNSGERGERENKIADCAPANDQNSSFRRFQMSEKGWN